MSRNTQYPEQRIKTTDRYEPSVALSPTEILDAGQVAAPKLSTAIRQIFTGYLTPREQAMLAQEALKNTAALSVLEAYLTNVAPTGAKRYTAIVDAYALNATSRVAKGGW